MNYQDLGGPTPFNYRPDDDSSKLSIGTEKKVKKVCSAFRKKKQEEQDQEMREMVETIYNFSKAVTIEEGKKKKSKKVKRPGFNSVSCTPDTDSENQEDDSKNLIMVGGLSGFDEQSVLRGKTYRQFKEHMLTSLYERKNRRKSRSKRSGAEDLDVRARKIKKLKNNDTHWIGLE